jgi:hypothetical protein
MIIDAALRIPRRAAVTRKLKGLYKAFRAGSGKSRKIVHARSNSLRRFRDRIAHHEPIFHKPSKVTHAEDIDRLDVQARGGMMNLGTMRADT